jgi:hypothetical protein
MIASTVKPQALKGSLAVMLRDLILEPIVVVSLSAAWMNRSTAS